MTPTTTACHEWTGCKNRTGYGIATRRFGTNLAHRIAWMEANGPIPPEVVILHLCDNPARVELSHLRPGSQAENMADCMSKGRLMTPANIEARRSSRRLTDEQVDEIRERYAAGGVTTRSLAPEYGVTHGYIHQVVTNRRRAS